MEGPNSKRIRNEQRQRELRCDATDAERRLWMYLRRRQVDGAKFRRQHPYGHYILDFACLERKIAIELDGGQHAERASYDARRTWFLEDAGFLVLRFWNNEMFENPEGVLEVIWTATRDRANPIPTQTPPLKGRA